MVTVRAYNTREGVVRFGIAFEQTKTLWNNIMYTAFTGHMVGITVTSKTTVAVLSTDRASLDYCNKASHFQNYYSLKACSTF